MLPWALAAQVFYHLGELDDALHYALCAGSLFQVEEQSEFVQTVIGASGRMAGPGGRPTHKLAVGAVSRSVGAPELLRAAALMMAGCCWLCHAARALDKYFALRAKQAESKEEVEVDPRLIEIVERMLEK